MCRIRSMACTIVGPRTVRLQAAGRPADMRACPVPGRPRILAPPVKLDIPVHCVSRYDLRVRFGETDLMGIVHHGTYISYFEVGRVEYMRRRGLDYHSWIELGIHLPVVEAYVRYRKSARFDELLCVE